MSNVNNTVILLARILLAGMFIYTGIGKLTNPAETVNEIASLGLPAATLLAYVTGLFELGSGLCVLTGFQVRIAGWLLALFCVFTGFVIHLPTVDVPGFPAAALAWINELNFIHFMKNITLAGAYIMLATYGAGAYSLDARRTGHVAHA